MGTDAGGQSDSSIQLGSCCLSRQHIAGGARMNRRILGSPISAKRDVGRVICLTVTTALGETLHGSKSMTVQCDTARFGMPRVKFTGNSHITLMSQVAASPIAERAHETSPNGLRNDPSPLASFGRLPRSVRQRTRR